jgi:hypothetical protein
MLGEKVVNRVNGMFISPCEKFSSRFPSSIQRHAKGCNFNANEGLETDKCLLFLVQPSEPAVQSTCSSSDIPTVVSNTIRDESFLSEYGLRQCSSERILVCQLFHVGIS